MTAGPAEAAYELQHDVPLAPLTTLGVGGPARRFVEARSERAIAEALAFAKERDLPAWILGGGSNVVIADEGLGGLVIHVATRGVTFEARGGARVAVRAAAGEPWDALVAETVARGLGGLECLSGIPGRVGATPVQNVGAYGQEVAETITSVRVLDRRDGTTRELSREDCHFAYRDSLFKSELPGRYVVLEVTFELEQDGEPAVRYADLAKRIDESSAAPTLAGVRKTVLAIRREKSMVLGDPDDENRRSCGSFFVNPTVSPDVADRVQSRVGGSLPRHTAPGGRVKLPAAYLIEQAGLRKGYRKGPVGLSTRHALALVCHEGATAKDVEAFAAFVVDRVRAAFGVELSMEPNLWKDPA